MKRKSIEKIIEMLGNKELSPRRVTGETGIVDWIAGFILLACLVFVVPRCTKKTNEEHKKTVIYNTIHFVGNCSSPTSDFVWGSRSGRCRVILNDGKRITLNSPVMVGDIVECSPRYGCHLSSERN